VRIAIDARELRGHPTGVGTYLSGILDAWTTMPSAREHEIVLFDAGRGTWWEQRVLPGLLRQARADVLFSPGYTSPVFSSVPAVVAIHDVSFAAHPEWFGWREGVRRRTLTRLCARRAERVLTISEFSRQEIVRHLGIPPAKVDVIYPAPADRYRARSSGPRENVILFVGSLFNRRHLPELIHAFARLSRSLPDARLEIVGDNRTNPRVDLARVAAESGAAASIALRSYVPDAELSALYQRARAFVFLSEYEGFGLTPLEALSAGIPIVVLDTPVAREVYGNAAVYVERADPALIEAALLRALTDEAERTRVMGHARQTLARYSWHSCAERVLQVLISSGCRASR
jgi:glycosyltransferase involved in cell wall biosynthesis